MNITNWHTSRITCPIFFNKEQKYYFWELSDIFKCELCMKTLKQINIWLTPCSFKWLQVVLQGILKSPFFSTNPFNSSWETKNSGCGLLRNPCHRSVSLQRVLPEMGCKTLSKCTKVTLPAPLYPVYCRWWAGYSSSSLVSEAASMPRWGVEGWVQGFRMENRRQGQKGLTNHRSVTLIFFWFAFLQ